MSPSRKPDKPVDRRRLRLGAKGERIAEKHLKRKGYRTAARNLRNKAGELDLVMWDDDELVVVEVRTVERAGGVWAGERVPVSKQRQLTRVARHLLAGLDDPLPVVRFDVVIVEMEGKPTVHHYENAIEVNG